MRLLNKNKEKTEATEVSEASIFSMFNLKGIFNKFALLLVALLFMNVNNGTPGAAALNNNTVSSIAVQLSPEEVYVNSVKLRIHNYLVEEVSHYILKMAPTSTLNAETLVSVCEKYNLDIAFVMAQALLESHFGTKGKAATTNSVWNVGTYDNGKIIYTYDTPNESIEPYAKLLHNNYLMLGDSIDVNDKNIINLLQDRGYINHDGKRFASARGYEDAMRKLMVKIDMETSIGMLQGIRRMNNEKILAFFGPPEKEELDYTEFYALN